MIPLTDGIGVLTVIIGFYQVIKASQSPAADAGFGVAGANDEATRPTIDAASRWSAVEIATR